MKFLTVRTNVCADKLLLNIFYRTVLAVIHSTKATEFLLFKMLDGTAFSFCVCCMKLQQSVKMTITGML